MHASILSMEMVVNPQVPSLSERSRVHPTSGQTMRLVQSASQESRCLCSSFARKISRHKTPTTESPTSGKHTCMDNVEFQKSSSGEILLVHTHTQNKSEVSLREEGRSTVVLAGHTTQGGSRPVAL